MEMEAWKEGRKEEVDMSGKCARAPGGCDLCHEGAEQMEGWLLSQYRSRPLLACSVCVSARGGGGAR